MIRGPRPAGAVDRSGGRPAPAGSGRASLRAVSRHPLRLGRPARAFVLPLIWTRPYAEVDETHVRVRFGWLGRADVPLDLVTEARSFRWPWWGGIGVRLGSEGLVGYVTRSGTTALLDLAEPVRVRMPVGWSARRILVSVEDVEGFLAAVAAARLGIGPEEG